MANALDTVDDAGFDSDVLGSEIPVLLEFTAPWCKPCKAIEPHLLTLRDAYAGRLRVLQLDIDVNLAVPSRYGVLALPTVVGFRNGEVVVTLAGAKKRDAYDDAVAQLLA